MTRLRTIVAWVAGRARHIWPPVAVAVVVVLTWSGLRQVHVVEVRAALQRFDLGAGAVAAALTALNLALMGLYDVVAFRGTGASAGVRWRYGVTTFAWSNFVALGPFAGPAIRLWLYRPFVGDRRDLVGRIALVLLALVSGLVGWTVAVVVVPASAAAALPAAAAISLALTTAVFAAAQAIAARLGKLAAPRPWSNASAALAAIAWADWLLAAAVFVACLRAVGVDIPSASLLRSFVLGQLVGVASLVPGGFGSADAFWIHHVDAASSTVGGALVAYRTVYYLFPWALASLALASLAMRRDRRRIDLARRAIAGLAALGGAVVLANVAIPAVHARLLAVRDFVPLPAIEAGNLGAAIAGLLLLVLSRGLARGYHAAHRLTLLLLVVAAASVLLRGLDWEASALLGAVAAAVWTQASLFDRRSRWAWLDGRDAGRALAVFVVFVLVGAFAHRMTWDVLGRWDHLALHAHAPRFLRTAAVLAFGVAGGLVAQVLRIPVRFARLEAARLDRALELHGRLGRDASTLMVANGDKDVFFDREEGLCLHRTAGPYVVVLSDPVVSSPEKREDFLDAFFKFASELDRRPLFYQVSLDWFPALHDRGYQFFKLGEEARVSLERFTLEGGAGKKHRETLRRAAREGLTFEVLPPGSVADHLDELRQVSDEWLGHKRLRERRFSIGFFDEAYLRRFPCAVVRVESSGEIVAFANLLPGPAKEEMSIDLMRHRSAAPPRAMDFLFVSLLGHAKREGYRWFNLGMAPLATVGETHGARLGERLAHVLFQHGERYYNFKGLRAYKDKFDPEWVPRYLAYPGVVQWTSGLVAVSTLISGGWSGVLGRRDGGRGEGMNGAIECFTGEEAEQTRSVNRGEFAASSSTLRARMAGDISRASPVHRA